MSNIYIQEPPTNGKVLLTTSLGDIDVELWSKEAPKACRNFVQLCMEGYYDDTIFHRVVKGFIAQGGDPTGTGTGGESIYGKPFKDEFHQRLKFNRRGLVAMANAAPNDNGSQFFFTLDRADELNKKHTIFGKVTGNTLYNMIRFNDLDVDENDTPHSAPKIYKTQVLSCPFDDIEVRQSKKREEKRTEKEKVKSKSKATKNYKLLSFGEEAEEDEEEADQAAKVVQIKSSHDVLSDPKLSSVPAVTADCRDGKASDAKSLAKKLTKDKYGDSDSGSESEEESKVRMKKKRRKKEPEERVDDIKAEMLKNRATKNSDEKAANDIMVQLHKERQQFREKQRTSVFLKKGEKREDKTLSLLKDFESNLCGLLNQKTNDSDNEGDEIDNAEVKSGSWMVHTLKFKEGPENAKDANLKTDDWYDIYDPRNPINKRRREASDKGTKKQ